MAGFQESSSAPSSPSHVYTFKFFIHSGVIIYGAIQFNGTELVWDEVNRNAAFSFLFSIEMVAQRGNSMFRLSSAFRDLHSTFRRHLVEQNETYWEHLRASFSLAGRMSLSCICLIIHGLLPPVLPRAGGDILLDASGDLLRRRRAGAEPQGSKNK
jgi:uncharacterized protein DUF6356